MSKILLPFRLTTLFLLTAVGLVPAGLPLCVASLFLSNASASQDYGGQDPGNGDLVNPLDLLPREDELMPRRTSKAKATRKKSRVTENGANTKSDSTPKTKSTGTSTKADAGQLTFSQDVAPILVANCVRCHSGDGVGLKKGKLDLSTFENLQKGGRNPKTISPRNPSESSLVLRIKGEETPRMPQGGNQVLSAEAIATIEQWVKQGAKLDKGLDPKKPIASYAASPEQVRRAQLARLPQQEVDKQIEATGLQRWKQANPKLKPEIVNGDRFVMFSNLPRERATSTLKVLEAPYGQVKKYLGATAADRVEKISIYVFASRKDFIEFGRSVESRPEVDADVAASGSLSVPQPYVAVVDPAGGRQEEPAGAKRRTRTRRGDEGQGEGGGADRSLNGLITEELTASTVTSSGKPPRWLALGIGSYLASRVERSPYFHQLRQTAFANWQQGWPTKANEVLGDQATVDSLRAVGFALVEAMMSDEATRRNFPAFVQGLLEGGEKLDDTLEKVYGTKRTDFIAGGDEWIAAHYGQLQ